jgi:cysteinyl-tRNA synthetase
LSTIRIYNSLSRRKEPFEPIDGRRVRMYVCGLTVYDVAHLGHARAILDVVSRWLRTTGYDVVYVRNITDIDDKIIARAVANGETIHSLTDRMIASMRADFEALSVAAPDHEPRATGYVPDMQALIERLTSNGLAYVGADGDVNFAVRKFPGYGRLSGKSLDELRAGERVPVDSAKADPLDFVLWKLAKDGEPSECRWPSPWGPGRPGWHIECSAMAMTLLGETIDIHGGGPDLKFPHHENEIAQSEGASGRVFARLWMHAGQLNVSGEKMSKSLGNFLTIRAALERYPAEVLRFFFLRAHYRSPINFGEALLDDARAALERLYRPLQEVSPDDGELDWREPYARRFREAMDDDFNTPVAMATLFDLATEVNKTRSAALARQLRRLGGTLAILQSDLGSLTTGAGIPQDQIEALIAQRTAAKQRRDFAEADRLRALLLRDGVLLEDKPGGVTAWRRR